MQQIPTGSFTLLLISAWAAVATAQAPATDTTGTVLGGYTFGSNVAGYLDLSSDICDIKSAIGPSATPNYAAAQAIYVNGRNSLKNDGTIRTLQGLATTPYTGEPTFDMYAAYFGTPDFLDQPIRAAFAGNAPYLTVPQRNETIVKGNEAVLQTVYLLHELDEAAEKIANRQLSAATGAPHNVDETWAIYYGADQGCSLWGTSTRRAREFGTMLDCETSRVNAAMLAAHKALYQAAAAGNLAAFQAQQRAVERLFLITYIQATLKYVAEMEEAIAAGDTEKFQAEQAEGYMFFRTIEPFIARANNRSIGAINAVLRPGSPPTPNALATVAKALQSAYAAYDITPADIGTYETPTPGLNCPTDSAASTSTGLSRAPYPDTTGNQISHATGFTFGSNVAGYLRLSTDICDIKAAIGPSSNPDYAQARAIYVEGRNSFRNNGSIRTLRELATTPYTGEPVYDMYVKYFGTPNFLDEPISLAFAGTAPYRTVPQRNETIVKGNEAVLQTVYLLHELDEAAEKIANRQLSAATGAPHNVDETWALYVGERPDCSLWGTSQKRSREFGTMQDCELSRVNAAMLAAHRALYQSAAAGDLAAFQAQQEAVKRLFLITNIQATLRYAELMDRATAAGDRDTQEADQAEGYMFFRAMEPFIAQANPASARTINNIMKPGQPIPNNALAQVKPALEATYGAYDISPSDIGSYGAQQNLNCPASPGAALASGAASAAGGSAGSATSSAAAAVPAGGVVAMGVLAAGSLLLVLL